MKLRIKQDSNPSNPRKEFDHLGTMVCSHRRYRLGDVQGDGSDVPEDSISLPLYLYDHSGITISTRPFSCPWDSGQVGAIYITRADVIKEWGDFSKESQAKAIALLECEVKEYDQFLTGDVWGFVIETDDGDHVDSCWGFYGRDYCETEGKSALEYAEKHAALLANQTAVAECYP